MAGSTMMVTVTLLGLLASAFASRFDSRAAMLSDFSPPSWYHKHDGPIFETTQSIGDDVELRNYEATKWVSTNVSTASFDDAYKQGTKRLDDYWKGENQPQDPQQTEGDKIDTTVPIVVLFYPTGTGESVQAVYTVEYFLPHELHAAPPAPTSTELGVVAVPAQTVWVQEFGGYVHEKDVMSQAFQFINQLKQQGVDVDASVVGVAFYDSIAQLLNRHNEIWVWGKPAPSRTLVSPQRTWTQWLQSLFRWHHA